jgi:uncharacterized membrane protein YkoI
MLVTMKTRTKLLIAGGALAAAVIAGTTAAATAGGGDDNETPIIGRDLDRATTAALEHTAGGRVTDTEVGDEESYYEVEVTLEDGSQIDVQLDRNFKVVGEEADEAGDDENKDDVENE